MPFCVARLRADTRRARLSGRLATGAGLTWLLACAACSHDSGTIVLVTDDEAGTFTQDPLPTTLQINEITFALDGGSASISTLVDATLPAGSIDLGNRSESTDAVLAVSGITATGRTVVSGASVLLDFGTLNGMTVPIFVQRKGQFARLPGQLSDMRTSPLLAVFNANTLLIAGGDEPQSAAATQLYDFGQLAEYSAPPTLPQAVQSIAFQGTVSWLISEDAGTYYDFSDAYSLPFSLPSGGGSFADIAGGATIVDPATANEYIVGATRTSGKPSQYVLEIQPTDTSNTAWPYGNPTWIALATPRLGAAALWIESRGELWIIGGNTSADAGVGIEVIPGGSTPATNTTTQSQYPIDFTSGAGAVVLDAGAVLLVGGVIPASDGGATDASDAGNASALTAGVDAGSASSPVATGLRVFNPNCPSSCAFAPWGPSLPIVLVDAQAFTADGTTVLIIGNDSSGATHAYSATSSGVTELSTRVPHTNARAITSPTGTVVLFGGSSSIESFTP